MAENQLERIAKIVERLGPLGSKTRGMPIEADDWNALVASVEKILEVDRAQEGTLQASLADNYARKVHDHLGQVAVAWLDAELQATMAEGSGGVSSRTAVATLGKRVENLATELARLTSLVEQQQATTDRNTADRVDQGNKIRQFVGRLERVDELGGQVSSLNGELRGLKTNVSTVLELRSQLTDPQGQPIDVAKLRDDVGRLRTLERRMTGADGSPLRLRDLELKLAELSDVVGAGGGGGLEARLATLSGEIQARLEARVDERTAAAETGLRGQLDANRAETLSVLEREVAEVRSGVTATVDGRATGLQAELLATMNETVTALGERVRAQITTETTRLVDSRLQGVPAQVQAGVVSARNELRAALAAELTGVINAQVENRVQQVTSGLASRLSAFEAAVGRVDQRVSEVANSVGNLDGRISAVVDRSLARAVAAQVEALNIPGQVEQRTSALKAELAGQVRDVDERLRTLSNRADKHEATIGEIQRRREVDPVITRPGGGTTVFQPGRLPLRDQDQDEGGGGGGGT